MIFLLFFSFIGLLLIAVPIGYAIGLSSLITIYFTDMGSPTMVIQRFYGTLDSYTMLAIPFFVVSGELMARGGMSTRMVNFAYAVVGGMRGSLAQVTIVASMIFAGVSGSGAADASAIGGILIPSMKQRGYPKGWASALQACAGTMGPIIPPSMIMIVYGSMTGVSIGAMFLGGAIPGILMGISLMIVVVIFSYLPGYEFLTVKDETLRSSLMETIKDGFLTLIAPSLIIGGIIFGVFTATEGGAIAAVYAFVVGYFVYKEITLSNLEQIMLDSGVTTGMVLLVTGVAGAFGWILTYDQFPDQVAQVLMSITTDKGYMLAIIVAFLLLLTCFVETLPALIMMIPVFHQISNAYGYDPVHFGVVVCIAAFIGTVTPPVGVLLYVSSGIAKCTLAETCRYIPPFLTGLVIVAFIVTFVPSMVTFLPHMILK